MQFQILMIYLFSIRCLSFCVLSFSGKQKNGRLRKEQTNPGCHICIYQTNNSLFHQSPCLIFFLPSLPENIKLKFREGNNEVKIYIGRQFQAGPCILSHLLTSVLAYLFEDIYINNQPQKIKILSPSGGGEQICFLAEMRKTLCHSKAKYGQVSHHLLLEKVQGSLNTSFSAMRQDPFAHNIHLTCPKLSWYLEGKRNKTHAPCCALRNKVLCL